MNHGRVAVLDIRSSEISVLVGAHGVNNTFVFNASHTESYYGYENGQFYDKGQLSDAIFRAISAVEKTIGERLRMLYVGVPGEFVRVIPKERSVGFPRKRKISDRERDALFESGRDEIKGYRFISATSMIYITSDNRRVVNPVGLHATSLSGLISYFYCSNYFAETMEEIFEKSRIELRYLPTQLAMANYLIPAETRDEYALFLDCGYLSSTISVVLGSGIMAQETFWVGKAHIIGRIMENLNVSFEVASALVVNANLYVKDGRVAEFEFGDEHLEIDTTKLAEAVKEGLDIICEAISGFLEACSGRELDFKPLYFTGEGLADIRGAREHVTNRVSRVAEPLVPNLPYYNKLPMSSRIALVDMAYRENRRRGFRKRL